MEVVNETGCGLRPMNCELNQLSRPDGSTMLMQGKHRVFCLHGYLASIFGARGADWMNSFRQFNCTNDYVCDSL